VAGGGVQDQGHRRRLRVQQFQGGGHG
jgi:hypothetical protein